MIGGRGHTRAPLAEAFAPSAAALSPARLAALVSSLPPPASPFRPLPVLEAAPYRC